MMTPTEKAEEIVLTWANIHPTRTATQTISDLIPMIAKALEEKEQESKDLRAERDEALRLLSRIQHFALQSDSPNFALVRSSEMEAIRAMVTKSKGGNS